MNKYIKHNDNGNWTELDTHGAIRMLNHFTADAALYYKGLD